MVSEVMTDKPETRTVHTTAAEFIRSVRPEVAAGGYTRDDTTIAFFTRVNALLRPDMTVIDLGAGRGSMLRGQDDFMKRLLKLQGKVEKVIGIDVDEAIAEHPYLDERHVVAIGDPYPLADASVDLICSDWVLEHIADPEGFVAEVSRVLKPGGWFCARTPNRWSYVGIAASLIPNALHTRVLAKIWPDRTDIDVFPTVYRMNTRGALNRWFKSARWDNFSYVTNPTPKYHANSKLLFGLIGLYQNLVPSALRTDMIVMLQKKP